jgi:Mor family transcriptional regulator
MERCKVSLTMPALLLDFIIEEEASMKYVNANEIFPDDIVAALQKYLAGGYVYIPAPLKQRKAWGEVSGYRKELEARNRRITEDYDRGVSMEVLANENHLSIYAIRKIIYQK